MRTPLRLNQSSPRGLRPALFLLSLLTVSSSGCFGEPTYGQEGWGISYPGAILLDDAFNQLVVEFTYTGDRAPSALALSAFEKTLREQTMKDSITLLAPRRIDPVHPADRSHGEVRRIHDQVRQFGNGDWPWDDRTFFVHVLYLNGNITEGAAGAYHGAGRITIMTDHIFTQVASVGTREPRTSFEELGERRMLVHELGHAFGLVNCEIPMVRFHESVPHTCHSDQTRSVLNGTSWTPPGDDPHRSVKDTLEVNWHFDEYDLEDVASFKRTGRTFTGKAPV